jgi:yeast amino acid transporter
MAIWNRKKQAAAVEADVQHVHEKGKESSPEWPQTYGDEEIPAGGQPTELHRGLKARHITMIAIGGAIGTGLIIGTGQSLARAG